jgi:putative transposase
VTTAAARREAVAFMTGRGLSQRRACELLRASRRWLKYDGRRDKDDPVLPRLRELAAAHPRYGYRRLHVLLRREGERVNAKRVMRLCVVHGLKLSRRRRRKRRGVGTGVPCRAEYPGHVWAYDFVHDACHGGRKLRILTVEDEFTRRCLSIEVGRRMPAGAVCRLCRRHYNDERPTRRWNTSRPRRLRRDARSARGMRLGPRLRRGRRSY